MCLGLVKVKPTDYIGAFVAIPRVKQVSHITFTFLFFVLIYMSEAFHTNAAGSCNVLLHTAGEPWTKNPFLLALIQG